jgi:hypothetical protein
VPLKLRGAPRSAASRIAVSAMATGATMLELRAGEGGSGGNATSTGAEPGAARSHIVHHLECDHEKDGDQHRADENWFQTHDVPARKRGDITMLW